MRTSGIKRIAHAHGVELRLSPLIGVQSGGAANLSIGVHDMHHGVVGHGRDYHLDEAIHEGAGIGGGGERRAGSGNKVQRLFAALLLRYVQ